MIKRILLAFGAVIMILSLALAIKIALLFTDRPNLKTNYVAEVNKITKPVDYDPNLNAKLDLDGISQDITTIPDVVTDVKSWPDDLDVNDLSTLRQWHKTHADTVERIAKACRKPYCWTEFESKNGFMVDIFLPHVYQYRHAAYILASQAKLDAMDCNWDAFNEHVLGIMRLGSLLSGNKLVVEQMIGLAIRNIAVNTIFIIAEKTAINSACLSRLNTEADTILKSVHYYEASRAQKCYMLNYDEFAYTDDNNGNGHLIPVNLSVAGEEQISIIKAVYLSLTQPNRKLHREAMERFYSRLGELLSISPSTLQKQSGPYESAKMAYMTELYAVAKPHYDLEMCTPSYAKICEISARSHAHLNALAAVLAVLQYRNDHQELPADLNSLQTSGYLAVVPNDPFSDLPLKYVRTENDFKIYSVGSNFVDDGGNDKELDFIIWPWSESSTRK